MKNIKKIFPAIIIFSLFLNIGAIPVFEDEEVPRDIAIAFKVGNANELARYFNKTIELVILDKEDVYSNIQAEVIMDDFFKDHYPKSFEFIHQGSKSESQYAIGKLVTFNGTYRVMLLLKKKNDKPLISQLRIEEEMNNDYLDAFIENAIKEDIGEGDHSSLSSIPNNATGKAKLIIKQDGILAGIEIAQQVFNKIDPDLILDIFLFDGSEIKYGDIAFEVSGKVQSILKAERLALNILQRMSGIATTTSEYVKQMKGLNCQVLDTRKTTPGMRLLEKQAVKIGGGTNHRMGLYDMIMLKDNHIDFAGGIEKAITKANEYRKNLNKKIEIEIEVRSIDDIKKVLEIGNVDRVMLDNFSIEKTIEAVKLINKKYIIESSGGITFETIRSYAECGVDFVSVGALTHQIKSLDMSLKADF